MDKWVQKCRVYDLKIASDYQCFLDGGAYGAHLYQQAERHRNTLAKRSAQWIQCCVQASRESGDIPTPSPD